MGKMETSPLKLSHGWSVLSSFALIVCPPLCPIVWTNLRGLLCDLQWYILCKRFTTFLNPSSEQRSTRNVQYQSIWVKIGLYCNWWARIHTRLSILFGMKIRKKTHFTTLIEAGAHQQPEKVKIHQFHPEETWAHLSLLLRACALINIRCRPDWDNCNRSTSFAVNMKIFWKRDCSFKINMHA